jgi:hypothetical protein
MEIVPTSTPNKSGNGLEELIVRKKELKQQIQNQKEIVSVSAKNILSPFSVVSSIFHSVTKSLNILDGVVIGFRIVRKIRKFFHRSR